MANKNIKVTSISDLRAYTKGQVVEFPPFADGMPFVARIRRPSVLVLAKNGKIPNQLLKAANDLFLGSSDRNNKKQQDDQTLSQMYDIFDIICEASFIEPTYKELKEIGLDLTDDQMVFLFKYTQSGVEALDSFRTE